MSQHRKVLIINVAINWGSTGRIVEDIGGLAESEGWQVFVAHGARYKNPSSLPHIQISTRLGEVFHFVESSLFDAQGLGSRIATRLFLKRIDDIIHIHNIHGCFLNYPILFRFIESKKIPVVWTLHDCWAMTGHCVHFVGPNCNKWQTICDRCPQKMSFPSSYWLDRSKRNYALKKDLFTSMTRMHITTVSSWLKEIAEASFLQFMPISVVPNGIKTSVFTPQPSEIREQYGLQGKKVLLAVATEMDERKGLYDYAKLASLLPKQYQLVLIGVNGRRRKDLPEGVIALKRLQSTKELLAYYSAADVLLSLSYEETFGMTIIEAMACGTPAIVYDNTAQPELITPETGIIVPTGDIAALMKAIEGICSKPKESFSSACRGHSLAYDEKISYQKYLDLYRAILD